MRSDCPISYILDLVGDRWSLLIVRDLMQGKRFYKEFLISNEKIATNILADRLKRLESNELIESRVYPNLKTQKEYRLTEKGQDLIPIILELMLWSSKHGSDIEISSELVNQIESNRQQVISTIKSGLNF